MIKDIAVVIQDIIEDIILILGLIHMIKIEEKKIIRKKKQRKIKESKKMKKL